MYIYRCLDNGINHELNSSSFQNIVQFSQYTKKLHAHATLFEWLVKKFEWLGFKVDANRDYYMNNNRFTVSMPN